MLIDVHTHTQFAAFISDYKEVIERARKAGVKMVCVGTQAATSEAAIKLAEKYPEDIWATVGYHPNHVVNPDASVGAGWYHDRKEQKEATPETFDIRKLRELAQYPKVVAIGECGLDYYRVTSEKRHETSERQKEVFLEHAKLAQELNKALMIHCRPSKGTDDAYEDLISLMGNGKWKMEKIVHFYVGSLAITKKLVDSGFYFTFGGVITFARDYDEAIKYIPLDRILTETDAPYVAPLLYRGKRNEPAYVVEVAKKMAEIKSVSYDKIVEVTAGNARKVFKL